MPFISTRIPVHFWFITKENMATAELNKSFSAASVVLAIDVAQTTSSLLRSMSGYVLSYIAAEPSPFLELEPFRF